MSIRRKDLVTLHQEVGYFFIQVEEFLLGFFIRRWEGGFIAVGHRIYYPHTLSVTQE